MHLLLVLVRHMHDSEHCSFNPEAHLSQRSVHRSPISSMGGTSIHVTISGCLRGNGRLDCAQLPALDGRRFGFVFGDSNHVDCVLLHRAAETRYQRPCALYPFQAFDQGSNTNTVFQGQGLSWKACRMLFAPRAIF